jgi:hypothetical protein
MSLIQEALKRKQGEDGKVPIPSAQVLPPAQGVARPLRPGGPVVAVRVLCYGILFVGALAGIVSLVLSFRGESAPRLAQALPEVEQPVPEARPLAPAAEPVPVRKPLDLVDPLEGVATDRGARRVVVREAPVRPSRAVTAAPPANRGSGPAQWPEVKVMGVFARPAPEPSTAIINGDIEEVGTSIEGVEIVQVRSTGVLFRYRGEDKFVRVGRSTIR